MYTHIHIYIYIYVWASPRGETLLFDQDVCIYIHIYIYMGFPEERPSWLTPPPYTLSHTYAHTPAFFHSGFFD